MEYHEYFDRPLLEEAKMNRNTTSHPKIKLDACPDTSVKYSGKHPVVGVSFFWPSQQTKSISHPLT